MFEKLLASVFSFFAVIAVVPLIVVIAVFLFKFNLSSFMDSHRLATAIIAGAYGFIWVFAFFAVQDIFMVWKPDPTVLPIGKTELIDKLERSFKKPFDGKALFDVFRSDDDRVAITWSSSINYFQIVSGGQKGKKRVVVLTLDENKHEAYLLMKEKDWAWSLSSKRFDFSMNFSAGIFAEISTEVVPSLTIGKDGSFSIDVKKLSYDYRELWLPIENTLLANGWTIRSGMLPKLSYRIILAVPLALLMFALFYFPAWKNPATPSSVTVKEHLQETKPVQETKVLDHYTPKEEKNLIAGGKVMSARDLETALNNLMNVPKEYKGDAKYVFIFNAYSKIYREKKDRNPEFVARLDTFAKEHGIE